MNGRAWTPGPAPGGPREVDEVLQVEGARALNPFQLMARIIESKNKLSAWVGCGGHSEVCMLLQALQKTSDSLFCVFAVPERL